MTRFVCRAVLLDMDGTLVDSTASVAAQWGRWARRHGLRLEDVLAIAHGRPSMETMRLLAPHAATPEEHARFIAEELEHEGNGAVAIQGAREFVAALPADRWAVVTSAPRELALRRVAAAGFPPPPVLIAPEDVERGKPDPMPYAMAASRLHVAAAECLAVEDAPAGIESARAAGMRVIGITTTYPREQLRSDAAMADFRELAVRRDGGRIVVEVGRTG